MTKKENYINSNYRIERMSGKDNTLVIRRKDGLIIAFIEENNGTMVSFRGHENRKISINLLNKIAFYAKRQGYKLTLGVCKEIGMSIVRTLSGQQIYITSEELKKNGLEKYLPLGENCQVSINNIIHNDIQIPDNSTGNTYDFHNSHIRHLKVGKNVFAEIDLRENQYIEKVEIEDSFSGKINLSSSHARQLHIGDETRAEVTAQDLTHSIKLNIGQKFSGIINFKDNIMSEAKIGGDSKGQIHFTQCMLQCPIIIGDKSETLIKLHNVYAKYILFNERFHGDLKITEDKAQLGVRRIFVESNFAGHIDLSNNKTIERIEIGKDAEGSVELIGTSSIKIIRLEENFTGKLDCRESGVVYISANYPCEGDFVLNDTTRLAEMKLPKTTSYRIYGVSKPLKIIKQKQHVIYKFQNIQLPKSYYQSRFPYSIWQKLASKFNRRH